MLLWSRPRRRFGDFAAAGKVTRRPQAAKSPRPEETISHLIYNKEAPSSCTPPYTQGGIFLQNSPCMIQCAQGRCLEQAGRFRHDLRKEVCICASLYISGSSLLRSL